MSTPKQFRGALAGLRATDVAIVNADIDPSAAIALSKLATNPLARANHTGTQVMSTISDAGTAAKLNVGTGANQVVQLNGSAKLPAVDASQLTNIPAQLPDIFLYGDGSDGDVTISSGVTTLTRDMYYHNLTISGTGQIQAAQRRIFVSGTLDISSAPANAIIGSTGTSMNGGDASGPSNGLNATGQGGAATGQGGASSAGKSGGTGAGSAGASGGAVTGLGGSGGAGGAGSAAGANAGGSGGAGGVVTVTSNVRRIETNFLFNGALIKGGGGGGSGGCGGGAGGLSSGGTGGSGLGGNVLSIYAKTITRGGSTAAGAIQVAGGNGGVSAASTNANCSGGGGSGGGGGGWLYIVYSTLSGSTGTNILDASGGNGSAGGNGNGTGAGGAGGASGAGGRVTTINVTSGVATETTGSASVAGSAGSGVNGGAGGTNTFRVSL